MPSTPEQPYLELLPAVDIKGGQAVQLVQGVDGSEKRFGDPIEAALRWQEAGAEWIHLVDLDAAFGHGHNRELQARIVGTLDIQVEMSGGIRDDESLEAAMAAGCRRVNIGTAALEQPEWCARAIATYGDRVAVGLDVRGTTLAARGWTREGGDLYETLARLDSEGCARYVVTDVNKDGMLQGPNLQLLRDVCAATDKPVVASGGVTTLDDIRALMGLVGEGVEGAIAGTALYEGRFTLEDALALTQGRLSGWSSSSTTPGWRRTSCWSTTRSGCCSRGGTARGTATRSGRCPAAGSTSTSRSSTASCARSSRRPATTSSRARCSPSTTSPRGAGASTAGSARSGSSSRRRSPAASSAPPRSTAPPTTPRGCRWPSSRASRARTSWTSRSRRREARAMSLAIRVIPCLDVDGGRVVKGVNFQELRDAGDPVELARLYDAEGADELTFLDISASHEGRATTMEVVSRCAEEVFIPLTVGGGVSSVDDVDRLLRAGADKVAVNTAAIHRPELVAEIADRFGNQVLVLSVDAAARRGDRRAASRSPPTAVARAPGSTRSSGPYAPPSSAPARSCSTRWTPTARPTASTSS